MDGARRAIPSVTTAELAAELSEPGFALVDVRPLAAFNGWRFADAARGGHLPGAVSFPRTWLDSVDEAEIERELEAKGIGADREIVVYGAGADDAGFVARALVERGRAEVRAYSDGFAAWAANATLPVERLERYDRLVHPGWLQSVLAGERPEAPPAGRALLFHVNFGVPEEYAEGHLPGALYLDTNWLESPDDIWQRRAPAELELALRRLGITQDTTVVLYGRDTEGEANEKWPGRRAGQIAATRAALILLYAGVDDVRILDGGYDNWVRAGHPLETVDRRPEPVAGFGASIPARPELIVDLPEAKAILADRDGAALVSVRTWNEHVGKVSGYNYIRPAGRIAGDVWGNCGSDAYHMQHYRTIDNTMRPYPEIVANWAEAGITPDKWIAFYCGTGWRASETWFYAYLMGWPRIAVYDGGWLEWSLDPEANPIEIGEAAVAA
jgi:3-mercaptopyruvate sulfurtransferase SseA